MDKPQQCESVPEKLKSLAQGLKGGGVGGEDLIESAWVVLCSEESIKFKVVRQKAQGESPILATKPRKIQHAFVRAKGRHKGTGRCRREGELHKWKDESSRAVFPVGLRVTYSETLCCITVTCQALWRTGDDSASKIVLGRKGDSYLGKNQP